MFQQDLLKGKVILITGGGTGLGKAMAGRFGQLGADLAIIGRRTDVLKNTAEELEAAGAQVIFRSCDIRDPEQVAAAMDQVYGHYGHMDVLINNAAGNFISPTERLSHRAVDAVINIVLHGSMYCTLEAGKRWIEAGTGGTVLNIVASYAWTGSGYVVPSAVAKAGVLAMTRSLAVEWAKYHIRQVAIAPGPFPTEGAWSRLVPTPELAASFEGRVPLGRTGDPSELANLAAYLISDYASFITGEVVTIDGGEWLNGAGEFNGLAKLTAEDWDHISAMIPRTKKS
ncbi:MAG: 2,4-dienoyl-CoA reductase [Sulfobacillus benefaciens]|uniref:2,4-dienoyl-CoA reductase n=1 Tax=Sulfobacillus benefaciens TaxID=453960 RepID=A0A2T2XGU7_9FIRM|nr:MAG: 2,4-dienoyl-CoA reductase [Sulfobacillus benefaciens]